jgi:hypothetical protein
MRDFRSTIRPAKHQRALSVLCLIGFLACLILSLTEKYSSGIIGFGFLSFFGLWNCWDICSYRCTIGDDHIEVSGMFGKKIWIPYSEISKAEIKYDNPYIFLYSDNEEYPIFKLNLRYENIDLLISLAEKMQWLK